VIGLRQGEHRAMERSGWLRRVGPWVGIGTSPAAMMMGGGVAQGLEGATLLLVLAVGTVALTGLALAQGLLGQRTGLALNALVAGPLGERASRRTASIVMLAMMLGWFGLNSGVGGSALARLLEVPDAVGIVLFSAAILAVVWFGIGVLSASALIAGVATVVLAVYGLDRAFAHTDVTLSGQNTATDPIGVLAGVALVVGYGAAFALRTPDFTHDLARPRQVVWCALAGLTAPLIGFVIAGAALQAATGTWDLADVLRELGSTHVAYLFLALGFTGSVLTNIWSGALSITHAAPRVGHRPALVAVAIVGGTLAVAGFSDLMLPYLTLMALAAPGLVVVCWLHALWGRRAPSGWSPAGLGAWMLGVVAGVSLHLAGSWLALPAAVVVPAVVYGLAGRGGEGEREEGRFLDPTVEESRS
jgi:cytosine permease